MCDAHNFAPILMLRTVRFFSVARASLEAQSVSVALMALGLILLVLGNYFPNDLISLTGAALTLLGVGSYYYRKYSYHKRPT